MVIVTSSGTVSPSSRKDRTAFGGSSAKLSSPSPHWSTNFLELRWPTTRWGRSAKNRVACFISLIPISDPDLVIPTIKHTLGLPESGNHSPLGHLAAYLREKQFLLLLDNFEHLLPAASQLPELLATCPRLKLLVTSRTTLHVKGEYEIAVPRWPFLTCSRCPPMRPCRR